jgi:uncharacterized protein
MSGEIGFFEIGVPDAARAKAFYGAVLDWTFHPMGDGDQAWIETPNGRGGLHDGDAERNIVLYFAVADIDAAVGAARAAGGAADDPVDEAGFGRFSACRDDQGVRFGLHQRL